MHRESTFLKRLADLSPAKQALLEKRLRDERQQEGDRTTDIPRRAQEEAAPLSFTQQRLWFMQQWEPESAVYNEVVAIRLSRAASCGGADASCARDHAPPRCAA